MLLYRTCERHERNSAHDSGTTPHSTQQFRLEYHTERETPSPETCVELTLGLRSANQRGENVFPVPECRRKKGMQKECSAAPDPVLVRNAPRSLVYLTSTVRDL